MASYNESAFSIERERELTIEHCSPGQLVAYRSCQNAGQSEKRLTSFSFSRPWAVAACCLMSRWQKIAMAMARRDPYHPS